MNRTKTTQSSKFAFIPKSQLYHNKSSVQAQPSWLSGSQRVDIREPNASVRRVGVATSALTLAFVKSGVAINIVPRTWLGISAAQIYQSPQVH
jgi:hypothetical protein